MLCMTTAQANKLTVIGNFLAFSAVFLARTAIAVCLHLWKCKIVTHGESGR